MRSDRLRSLGASCVLLAALAGCPTVDLGDTPTDIGLCNPPGGVEYFQERIWPEFVRPGNANSCTKAGVTINREVDVPPQGVGTLTLEFDVFGYTTGTPRVEVDWVSSGMPAGTTFNLAYDIDGGGVIGVDEGLVEGTDNPVVINYASFDSSTRASLDLDAVFDGKVIATARYRQVVPI